jgi:hypothetical protein
MNPAVEQLRAAVERLVHEGRVEGITPGGPLGGWLEAQSEALEGLAAVLDGQEERFEALLTNIRAANQTELAKLSAALDLAKEAVRQGNQAISQARNAQIAATVQQEAAVQRMIDETLPMFADRLKAALVIREARWNRERVWKRCALAGVVVLAIFGSGYGLAWWSDWDRMAAFNRCLAQPVTSGGHVYCVLDSVADGSESPVSGQQG